MEETISNQFKFLYNEFIKQSNTKKRKNSLNNKNRNNKNKKNNQSKDLNNEDLIVLEEEEKDLLKELDKKYLINFLNINHYYEYYLLKDVLKEVDAKKFSINFPKLKKITKKYFTKKFEAWINMDEITRLFFKNEFNQILGIKDTENDFS